MDILPTDLDGVIGYDIKEVTKHFSNLKKKSESIFKLKILQEPYRIISQQKLDNLEKEVKKMNTVIENIEKRYMIVSTEEETTLGQVFGFLKLWDEIVGKAKKEAAQNKKAGETKDNKSIKEASIKKQMLKTLKNAKSTNEILLKAQAQLRKQVGPEQPDTENIWGDANE
tara:strand:+ start:75 stop:584 length:510 start_codon:yes stop_codon:yes gene_type:complete